jgi:hypothetical protein
VILRDDGQIRFPNIATTASGANAHLASGSQNSLFRSTSSLRYKDVLQDMGPVDARTFVMGLRPFWYRSTAPVDDQDRVHPGFASEEVAALDDRFVFRDGEGRPDGVAYDRLTVPLAAMVQDLERRVAQLEVS